MARFNSILVCVFLCLFNVWIVIGWQIYLGVTIPGIGRLDVDLLRPTERLGALSVHKEITW